MSDLSFFESRYGRVTCNAEEIYAFVTDMQNFTRFAKPGTVRDWKADRNSCSFSVSMLGTVSLRLAEKEEFSKVVFSGDALKKNDFSLSMLISDNLKNPADIKVILTADLNPMMKIMAVKPIEQFLEMIIHEMEIFREWKDIKK